MSAGNGWMSVIMFMTGVGIPIMAALNSALGARIGAPGAATVLFVVAFVLTLTVTSFTGGVAMPKLSASPAHLFLGGLFVAFYVLSITMLAPKMGVATAVLFVLLGQLCSAAVIDHFGLFGALRTQITPTRCLGLALMAVGIMLAKRPVGT